MLQGWLWKWMVAAAMTGGDGGGRCQRRRKMMVRNNEGEEKKPCSISLVPRVSENEITEKPSKLEKITELPQQIGNGIDFYTQARKALSLRCPFDSEESNSQSQPSSSSTLHLTLPNNLAQLLNKNSDSRKRHKKSHAGTETKKKSSSRQKGGRNSGFWDDVEEYFRVLTVEDIDRWYKLRSFEFLGNDQKLLYIPTFENVGSAVNDSGVTAKEEKENEQFMDVDSEGGKKIELFKEENDGNVKKDGRN